LASSLVVTILVLTHTACAYNGAYIAESNNAGYRIPPRASEISSAEYPCSVSSTYQPHIVLVVGQNTDDLLEIYCPANYVGTSVSFAINFVPEYVTVEFRPSSTTFEALNSTTSTLRTVIGVAAGPQTRVGTYEEIRIGTRGIAQSGIPGAMDMDMGLDIMIKPPPDGNEVIMLVRPDFVILEQGSRYVVVVDVFLYGDTGEPLSLSVEGLPNGVTAELGPDLLSTSTSLGLGLAATPNADLGNFSPRVVLASVVSGSALVSIPMNLTITTSSTADYRGKVYVSPRQALVTQGGETVLRVTLEGQDVPRCDSPDSVGSRLVASGLPDGITASFDPEALGSSLLPFYNRTSDMTITITDQAEKGTYSITVHAVPKCSALFELYWAPEDVSLTVLPPSEQTTTTTTAPPPGAVPGFPLESIAVGVLLGAVIAFFRSRRVGSRT
jgi:hypothetical protein